jgi:hypothetical protein
MERIMAYQRMKNKYTQSSAYTWMDTQLQQERDKFCKDIPLDYETITSHLQLLEELKQNEWVQRDGWMDVIEYAIEMYQQALPKYKKKSIPSALKRKVWYVYMGEDKGTGLCMCCKIAKISSFSFHCGHVISEKNGGKMNTENLRPICQNCNSSMGTSNMNDFMAML